MVDRANIKQIIPALPDEKIGNYISRTRDIHIYDSMPLPGTPIHFYCFLAVSSLLN